MEWSGGEGVNIWEERDGCVVSEEHGGSQYGCEVIGKVRVCRLLVWAQLMVCKLAISTRERWSFSELL